MAASYREHVSESQHLENIAGLANRISANCHDVLIGGHLRIGTAQKALNLYLKYLWCLGRIPEPPHCPLDRTVISKLPPQRQVPWTQIDDIAVYQSIVQAAKEQAGSCSLAEWELGVYEGD
jgi:hypothetical protein